ncbi:MAG: lipopolysaccharide transport periplasmic protein LptA [Thermodesulfobacteriota bacterium]
MLLAVGIALRPGGAAAQSAPAAAAPIHIEADRLESDAKEEVLHFLGHVEATQGDMVIRAERMTVTYVRRRPAAQSAPDSGLGPGAGDIDRIRAEGGVRITRKNWVATGDNLEYVAASRQVILTGAAQVWQADNSVSGERIVLYLDEGRSVVEKGGSGRVKALIYPERPADEARP